DRTGKHRAFIGEDIAEHILHHDDVEAPRVEDQLHRAVIHQQVIQLAVRIVPRDLYDHPPPELRRFQNVRLIDGGYFLAPGAREMEGHTGNTLDFRACVSHGIDS